MGHILKILFFWVINLFYTKTPKKRQGDSLEPHDSSTRGSGFVVSGWLTKVVFWAADPLRRCSDSCAFFVVFGRLWLDHLEAVGTAV